VLSLTPGSHATTHPLVMLTAKGMTMYGCVLVAPILLLVWR
jgi:hypothetical protein